MSISPFQIYSPMSPGEEDVYTPVKPEDLFYSITKNKLQLLKYQFAILF